MNREQLDEIRALAARRPAPGVPRAGWRAELARRVPALLDEIDRLTRELDTMREVAQGNKRHVAYLMSELEQVTCGTCGAALKAVGGGWWHSQPTGDYKTTHPPVPVFPEAPTTAEGSAEGGNPKGSSEDPLVVAVLDRAIVWRQEFLDPSFVNAPESELSAEEHALIDAVDAMLSARHNLRETGKETS